MRAKLDIDKHRLDVELESQAEYYHEAAEELALARSEVDNLKGKLEYAEATLDYKIRENPADYGITRISGEAVKAAVLREETYQLALTALNKAKLRQGKVQAYVDALDIKKSSIESLVKLRLADYFADPRVPKEEHDGRAERRGRADAETAVTPEQVKSRRK